jgi:4-carboxymuconolactone decarboxylase
MPITDTPTMRFPPLRPEDWSDAQRRVAAEIISGPRGELRGPFVPLIHSPVLAAHVQRLGEYLRFGTRLPNDLIELAVLVTARRFGCANIWHAHRALALKAGVAPGIIAAIAAGRRPAPMSRDETIVFDFAHALVHDLAIGDQAFDRVAARWDRATAMDLTGVCGYYTFLAMVLNTAQVPLPEGAEPFQP